MHVIGPSGKPHSELTVYANKARESLAKRSVPVYLGELLRLFSWLARDEILSSSKVSLLGTEDEVRRVLRDYLTADCRCQVRHRRDDQEITFFSVRKTDETRVNVGVTLAATKHFYALLRANGLYKFSNPLVSEFLEEELKQKLEAFQREHMEVHGRHSPGNSGGVDDPWGHRLRYSTNYFQVVNGEWRPTIISDPRLHILVYKAGEKYGWKLREQVIARIIFESGPRGSEAVERTLSDWIKFGCLHTLDSASKGSDGVRVKSLVFSTETANLLRRYWNTERADCETGPYKTLAEFQNAAAKGLIDPKVVPIFLSRSGKKYSIATFRDYYWRPALSAAELQCQIHQIRHWFVTQQLEIIDKTAKSPLERQKLREEFIEYMHWSSGAEMLRVYDHAGARVADYLHEMHSKMNAIESEYKRTSLESLKKDLTVEKATHPKSETDADLELILKLGSSRG